MAVRERARPEHDPTGIDVGYGLIFPEFSAGLEYTSNVFGTDQNAQSDLIGRVGIGASFDPRLNRHALSISAAAAHNAYQDNGSQDYSEWSFGAQGRLDYSSNITSSAELYFRDTSETVADTPTLLTLAAPIDVEVWGGKLGLDWRLNRLDLSAFASLDRFDYSDGRLGSGAIVDQDERDREVRIIGARADYGVSPGTGVFVSIRNNWREQTAPSTAVTINRDSSGYEVLGGVSFDVTNVIEGEIGVGAYTQNYDAVAASDSEGFAARARLDWYPDELISVAVEAGREVTDAGVSGAAGAVATTARMTVDYEFRRNIVVGANLGFGDTDYEAVDRQDDYFRAGIGVDYALNRIAAMGISVTRYDQESRGLQGGRSYERDTVTASLRLRR